MNQSPSSRTEPVGPVGECGRGGYWCGRGKELL